MTAGDVRKVAIFLLSLVALLFFQIKHPLENEVTVVDIGQGDSIFVRDVKGHTLLIDVGGKVSFSEKNRMAGAAERIAMRSGHVDSLSQQSRRWKN
jgi:beta-lactamase superfamily II metal-dependent hydrolase